MRFDEGLCYKYVRFIRDSKAPPTRAFTFVASIGFCVGVLGIAATETLGSARFKGAALGSFRRKRPLRKSRSLRVAELRALELGVSRATLPTDRYLSGVAAFCAHARFRAGDVQKIETRPRLDKSSDGTVVFIEVEALIHKTGDRPGRRRVPLPVVAHGIGVTGEQWAEQWLRLYDELGIAKLGTMLPTPRGDGHGFLPRPLGNEQKFHVPS